MQKIVKIRCIKATLKHILELLEAGQESYENMNSYRNQNPWEHVHVLYNDSYHDLV